MKKFIAILSIIISICVLAIFLPEQSTDYQYDYLRLHIRANSNSSIDQNVKYLIKDHLVEYLTPYLSEVESKEEAVAVINSLERELESRCIYLLRENGFSYSANVKIANEYFPTRTYNNVTLESGYYDAVIVELGTATGDNWWCVMYPPLCFVNNFENSMQINYKSKLIEWIKNLFS